MFTSGTTGESKGAMISHKNLVSNCLAFAESQEPAGDFVVLSVLPFHHCLPIMLDLLQTVFLGGTLCLNRSLRELDDDFQFYRPTYLTAVPLLAGGLIKKITNQSVALSPEEKAQAVRDFFGGRLKAIKCGGAMIPEETALACRSADIILIRGYGITECTTVVSVMSYIRNDYDNATIGTPLSCNRVKIIDGEICVSGDNVMLGYYNNPEGTADAFYGTWFRTGDLGYLDEKGDLYITGRLKHAIILESGKNVCPEEIEALLLAHDDVLECIVFEYKKSGRKPVIAAIIRPSEKFIDSIDQTEVREYFEGLVVEANKNLPPYKQVSSVFLSAQEFEKTSTRKVIRSKVCERVS
jgi:long-chain acyl-CoA synthetase